MRATVGIVLLAGVFAPVAAYGQAGSSAPSSSTTPSSATAPAPPSVAPSGSAGAAVPARSAPAAGSLPNAAGAPSSRATTPRPGEVATPPIPPPGTEASTGGPRAGAAEARGATDERLERLERRNREINSTVMQSICRGC